MILDKLLGKKKNYMSWAKYKERMSKIEKYGCNL